MCKGEACGAVTGALMAIGLIYGQFKQEDLEALQKTSNKTVEMLEKFMLKKYQIIIVICNRIGYY